MASEDDGVVRLAPQDDPAPPPQVAIHLSSSSSSSSPSSSSPSLTVIAPLLWLSRIPYFATLLQEPWSPSSPPPLHLSLHCTPSSPPHAYLRCLQLLRAPSPCSPHMLKSIPDVLDLLPVADHLLFEECWDACMLFLAASPWSWQEEDDIRTTISNLNFKASADVHERLDTSKDIATLEYMLDCILSPPSPSTESFLSSLCEKYLGVPPTPIKVVFQHVLLELHTRYANKVLPLPSDYKRLLQLGTRVSIVLPNEWYVITKLLLRFTDAHELIVKLINLKDVMWLMLYSCNGDRKEDTLHIIKDILNKTLTKVVFLTNSQRAMLLEQLKGYNNIASIESMKQSIAETLPLANQRRRVMVKTNSGRSSMWIDHLFHRIGQLDEQLVKDLCKRERAVDQ